MNIRKYINKQKTKFKAKRTQMSQVENVKKAEELQKLREERIKLEGKANLEKARNEELRRIEAAKKANPNKLQRFGMGLKKLSDKAKARETPKKFYESDNSGIGFGGSGSPFSSDLFNKKKK